MQQKIWISRSLKLFFLITLGLVACSKEDSPEPDTPAGPPQNVQLTAQATITDSQQNKYLIGFDQASSNNQNPYIIKQDAQGKQIWKVIYENTAVDGRGLWITLDSNDTPWAVFTVDGGSSDGGFINKKQVETGAFTNVYMNSYGSGGGPKASVLAQIDKKYGQHQKRYFHGGPAHQRENQYAQHHQNRF